MPTREIEYTTRHAANQRLVAYAIRVTSAPARYVAEIWEKLPAGERRRVVPRQFSNMELPPAQFFGDRPYHRAMFVRLLQESLEGATAEPPGDDELPPPELFLGANVAGYPNGFAGAVDDDLNDWIHAVVIPDEGAPDPAADSAEAP